MARPPSVFAVFAAALLCCGALLAQPAAAQAPANIRLCYLFFGGVDDLGYTFSFNVARLKIHENIEAMFPGSVVTSMAAQGVFFMPPAAKRAVLADFVRSGCNIVASNSEPLLHDGNYSEVSAMYPNVTFFALPLTHQQVLHNDLPNFVYMVQVPRQAYYVKGAAAARQASTCVGVIAAWEREGNAMDAINGVLRGIRDEHATIPIHVVTMNSWYWPDGETDAARLMMRLGCEVVVHYTDPRVVDVTVASEAPSQDFFSIGPHSDLQRYVGDTVLVASYVAWDIGLTPLFAQVLRDGRPNYAGAPYAFGRGVVLPTELSPRSSQAAREAFVRAKRRLDTNPDVYCGVLRLRNGTVVNSDPSRCLNLTYQTPLFLETSGTTFHGSFSHRSDCAPGTYATYAVTPTIALTCTPCPVNTFSTEAGEYSCTPCPNGTVATPGSTVCTQEILPTEDDGLATWAIAVIAIAAILVVALAALGVAATRKRGGANHDAAPKKPPLCIIFTDIESSTELWQAHDRMGEAVETHHRVIREVLLEYGGYEIKTVGDSFMIAVAGVVDAVMIAVAIQRGLQAAEWPDTLRYLTDDSKNFNGLKVRVGVHYCEEVEPKYESERDYWDYYGSDVNLAARVESQARGGQILLSHMTVEKLQADPSYESIIAPDVSLTVFARNVELKGVAAPTTLYSMTPAELAGRRFEPLAGYEDDAEQSKSATGSFYGTASTMDDGMAVMLTQRTILTVLQRLLSKSKHKDRTAVMKVLAADWDPTAQSMPVAHQMRAIAASSAVDSDPHGHGHGHSKTSVPRSAGDPPLTVQSWRHSSTSHPGDTSQSPHDSPNGFGGIKRTKSQPGASPNMGQKRKSAVTLLSPTSEQEMAPLPNQAKTTEGDDNDEQQQ